MEKGDARVLAHELVSEFPAVLGKILRHITYIRLMINFQSLQHEGQILTYR